jgi:hypothetical protein
VRAPPVGRSVSWTELDGGVACHPELTFSGDCLITWLTQWSTVGDLLYQDFWTIDKQFSSHSPNLQTALRIINASRGGAENRSASRGDRLIDSGAKGEQSQVQDSRRRIARSLSMSSLEVVERFADVEVDSHHQRRSPALWDIGHP